MDDLGHDQLRRNFMASRITLAGEKKIFADKSADNLKLDLDQFTRLVL